MIYDKVEKGRFLSRPNRFIAYVEIGGKKEVCHVKNTGRCRELLLPGAVVYLEASDNPVRKTKYDLIAVEKGSALINMDSQAPNRVFSEWAASSGFFGSSPSIFPERKYGSSRFDFYIELDGRRIFVEVKGVTLEEDGVAKFPDAPTERGARHLRELSSAVSEGYEAYVFFIIQMKGINLFTPNETRDPSFARELRAAKASGVGIFAIDSVVTPDSLTADAFVKVEI